MSGTRVSSRAKKQTEFTGDFLSSEDNIGFDPADMLGDGNLSRADIEKLEALYNVDGTSRNRRHAAGYDKNAPKPRTLATDRAAGAGAGAGATGGAASVAVGEAAGVATGEIADAAVDVPVKVEDSADDPYVYMPHHTPEHSCVFVDDEGGKWHAHVLKVNISDEGRSITLQIEGCDQIILVPEDQWNTQIEVDTLYLTLRKWNDKNAEHGFSVVIVCDRGYDPEAKSREKMNQAQEKQRAVIAHDFAKLKHKWDREGILYDKHSAVAFAIETQGLNRDAIDVDAQLQSLKDTCSFAKYRDAIIAHAKALVTSDDEGFFCPDDIVIGMEIDANLAPGTLSEDDSFLDYLVKVLINCDRVHHTTDQKFYDRALREINRGEKSEWLRGVLNAHKEQQKQKQKKKVTNGYFQSVWIMTEVSKQTLLRKKAKAVRTKAVNVTNTATDVIAATVAKAGTTATAAEAVPAKVPQVYMPLNVPFSTNKNPMGITPVLQTVCAYVKKMLSTNEEDVKRNPFQYLGIDLRSSTTHAEGCARAQLRVVKNKKNKYNLTGMTKDDCEAIQKRLNAALEGMEDIWTREQKALSYVNPNSKEGEIEKELDVEEVEARVNSMKPSKQVEARRKKHSAKTHVAMMKIKQEVGVKLEAGTSVKEEKGAASTSKKRPASSSPTAGGGSKAAVDTDAHEAGAPEVSVKQEKLQWYATMPKISKKKNRDNGGVGQ